MKPIGVLVLHGFCSSLDTVNGLAPHLEAADIPYRMPYLRGHGKTPDALKGVRHREWVDDGAAALNDLLREVEETVIVGLSMGALVTLALAKEHMRLSGLVLVAPFLEAADPLAKYCEYLAPILPKFPMPKPPKDEAYVCTNYTWFPTATFVEVFRFQKVVKPLVSLITQPLMVLYAENDKVAKPSCARWIHENAASADKGIRAFTSTGHEMMQGKEKEDVFGAIMAFIEARNSLQTVS